MKQEDIKEDEFDDIFCKFMDLFTIKSVRGRKYLSSYPLKSNECERVMDFFNNGIMLLSEEYSTIVFVNNFKSRYEALIKHCTSEAEINKINLIYKIMQFLSEDDYLSFFKTSIYWSKNVRIYGYLKFYPHLTDELKELYIDEI